MKVDKTFIMRRALLPLVVDTSTIGRLVDQIILQEGIDSQNPRIRDMDTIAKGLSHAGVAVVNLGLGTPGIQPMKSRELSLEEIMTYPDFRCEPQLREAAPFFFKQYFGIDRSPQHVYATTGGMGATFTLIALLGRMQEENCILNLAPGFSLYKAQAKFLGVPFVQLDVGQLQGKALVDCVEEKIKQLRNVRAVMYSSPSNPTWKVYSETELAGLGTLCERYDMVAIEDLAYAGLDSRMSTRRIPGIEPYFPTIARYTDLSVQILSGSKILSIPAERTGVALTSERVASLEAPGFKKHTTPEGSFHTGFVHTTYLLCAGAPKRGQLELADRLSQSAQGTFNYFKRCTPYEQRSRAGKEIFGNAGFTNPYGRDDYGPIGDGFYFTVAHPAYQNAQQLAFDLLKFGIVTVPLDQTSGTEREDCLRICTSQFTQERLLQERLEQFSSYAQMR